MLVKSLVLTSGPICNRNTLVAVGIMFARYILIGCWKNLIDTLSTPLTGRMAGSSRALAFILGAEGVKVQNQRERETICLSLDGLRKAAALSCALGNEHTLSELMVKKNQSMK